MELSLSIAQAVFTYSSHASPHWCSIGSQAFLYVPALNQWFISLWFLGLKATYGHFFVNLVPSLLPKEATWLSSRLQTLHVNNSKEESEPPKETPEPTLVLINHGIANKPRESQPVTVGETENFQRLSAPECLFLDQIKTRAQGSVQGTHFFLFYPSQVPEVSQPHL